jgi:hypothetical protein
MGLWHKALTTNVWLIKKSFNIESWCILCNLNIPKTIIHWGNDVGHVQHGHEPLQSLKY